MFVGVWVGVALAGTSVGTRVKTSVPNVGTSSTGAEGPGDTLQASSVSDRQNAATPIPYSRLT